MDEQPQLIDQAAAQEGLHKRDASHDRDVPAVRLLELGQLLRDRFLDERGVLPSDSASASETTSLRVAFTWAASGLALVGQNSAKSS
jgi:hypothetical protein